MSAGSNYDSHGVERQGIYQVSGFPNVLRAINSTHIVINKPAVPDWFVYINRKNKFSINVQMVRNCIIINMVLLCFGVMKSRFRALHDTGGTILYSPNKVCKMVVATAILHNICLKYGVENPEINELALSDGSGSSSSKTSSVAIALHDELALNFEGG
ncbi:uncharacterized protein LOC118205356, partial [Stegodyphus dumicola]|uniref:uncharacterized protein LOC118205356 n=1 Tax=Stegodyphus dumicola TaxID=202533 RepID=UPI0015ABD326